MGDSFRFTKDERLTNHHLISALFNKKGKSIFKPPILFAYIQTELKSDFPVQVIISVAKKKFNKAHQRNKIRRKIREAYRLNKHLLYPALLDQNKQIALAIMYLENEDKSYQEIETKLKEAIDEFVKRH